MRKLGENQIGVLEALKSHGAWKGNGGGGWIWENLSVTKRIMESLVKRGLVEMDEEGWYSLVIKDEK